MNAIANLLQTLRKSNAPATIDDLNNFKTKSLHFDLTENVIKTEKEFREIKLSEVAMHDDYEDCWIVIYDRVYNVTKFLKTHPGGEDMIMDYAGRDATLAFRGTGHSNDAIKMLEDFLIGELPQHERIFRRAHGILGEVPL